MKIENEQEWAYCLSRGIEPMRDKHFEVAHDLRVELQEKLFGKGNHVENNKKFYRYAWKIATPKVCEECGKPLENYDPTYISHILSRGESPQTAYDLRNFNLLCARHHEMWESKITRKSMRIYERNQKIISILREEYGK